MSGVKKASAPPQDEIEAAASAMTAVRAANGGNPTGVSGSGQPIVNGGADPSALDWRVARPMMPGDQQHDTVAGRDRLLQRLIDRVPGTVEGLAVQIDDAVGLHRPLAQRLVPAAVERRPDFGRRRCGRDRLQGFGNRLHSYGFVCFYSNLRLKFITR